MLFLLFLASASGMVGIAYEIIYFRIITSFIFGEISYVVNAILIGVFAGLAVGAYISEKVYPLIWVVEVLLGCFSVLVFILTRIFGLELVHWMPDSRLGSALMAFLLCFLPFFLIGVAVPAFSLLLKKHCKMSQAFVSTYSVYNIFAAFSILLAEYFLIRKIGLTGALFLFGIGNFIIGIALYLIVRKLNIKQNYDSPPLIKNIDSRFFYGGIALGIFGSMWQLLYLDFSLHYFGPFQETFSLVFFSALLGIGIGSAIARWSKVNNFILYLAIIALLVLLALTDKWLFAFTHNFGLFENISHESTYNEWESILLLRQLSVVIFGLPLFCLVGMFVPLIFRKTQNKMTYGSILAIVSIGNMLGVLAYTAIGRQFLTIPFTVMLLLLLLSIIILTLSPHRWRSWKPVAILALPVATAFPLVFYFPTDLLSSGSTTFVHPFLYKKFKDQIANKELLFYNFSTPEGKNYVMEDNSVNSRTLIHMGYRVFGLTDLESLVNRETSLGALAAFYAEHNNNAYLIGLGSGITAMGTAQFFKKTTIVDINPAMKKIVRTAYADINDNVINKPNVKIITQDAIVELAKNKQKYDSIINTASSPLYFSANKIYTSEFYRLVASKLNDNGVYVGWMDSRVSWDGIMITRQTLLSAFNYCDFFALNPAYYIFSCGNHPIKMKEVYDKKQKFDIDLFEEIRIPDHLFQKTHLINSLDAPLLSYARLSYQSLHSSHFPDTVLAVVYQGKDVCYEQSRAIKFFTGACDYIIDHDHNDYHHDHHDDNHNDANAH